MGKITTWKDIWDFSNLTDINKAIKALSNLDKVYEDLIAATKKGSTEITANNAALVKSLDNVAASTENLTAATKKEQKEIQETNSQAKALDATYKSQAKQIATLEAQIKKLSKERSNVAKKTTDLNNINKKAISLEAQIGRETGKAAKENANLALQLANLRKARKLEAQEAAGLVTLYQKESATLIKLRSDLKDLILQEKGATKEGKALAVQVATLDARLKGADAAAGQFQRNVGGYTQALGRLKVGFSQVAGALGLTSLVFGFVAALKGAFNTVRTFQKENAVLAGVLNKTRDQITELTEDAKRLGATTAKSATEVNKLQLAYARLGFTQEEIIELTADTINGSIALNAELDETAELTGALIRTFDDLKTTDAGSILDKLARSAQLSGLNFQKLQTALPIVAGAANAAGVSFERTVALLGKLSDAGIDASSSSTALRNIFIEAASQGLNYEEILVKIGNSQDKLTAANDEFGKRGAVSASILANLTEEVKGFETELLKAGGTSKRVAEENLNTLDGQIILLSSSWEGLILSIESGDGALSKVAGTIVNVTKGFFDLLRNINDGNIGLALYGEQLEDVTKKIEDNGEAQAILKDAILQYSTALEKGTTTFEGFLKIHGDWFDETDRDKALLSEIEKLYGDYNVAIKENVSITEAQERAIRNAVDSLEEMEAQLLSLQDILRQESRELSKFNDMIDSISDLDSSTVADWAKEDADALKEATTEADKYYQSIIEGEEKAFKALEKHEDKKALITNTAFETASILGNQKFENDSIRRDKELLALQSQKERELEIAGDNEQKKAAIEAKFKKKEDQIKAKQDKADKKRAIFNILLNTATAVVEALPNIPLSIAMGVIGGVELAAVASQPLPAYEDGGTVTTDGAIITSEKGYEYAVTPKGELIKTGSNGAEIRSDIPKGSHIFNHAMSKQLDSGAFDKRTTHDESNNSIQEYIKRDKIQTAQIIAHTLKVENDYLAKVISKAIKDLPEVHQFKFNHGRLVRDVSQGGTTRKDWKSKNND